MSAQADSVERFSPVAYLLDEKAGIAVCAACLTCVAALLAILGLETHGIVLICATVGLAFSICLAWGYARRARYYRDLAEATRQADTARLALELLDEPSFLGGRVSHKAQAEIVRLCSEELTSERERARAHREYVELWVHEAKTPIAAARLILSRMHGPEAVKLAYELDRIEAQVEQALYYARSTSLSNDYAIRELDLGAVAKKSVKGSARLLIEKGVQPRFDIPEGMSVLSDETWLCFVLSQVVANAAKYGSTTVTFTAREEQAGTPHERTVLEIIDDGCGIPAQDVPRVFDRGFTGENGRAFGQATGMGLHLAALMCDRMGLGIAIASEQGKGTRVIFTFPHDRRHLSL